MRTSICFIETKSEPYQVHIGLTMAVAAHERLLQQQSPIPVTLVASKEYINRKDALVDLQVFRQDCNSDLSHDSWYHSTPTVKQAMILILDKPALSTKEAALALRLAEEQSWIQQGQQDQQQGRPVEYVRDRACYLSIGTRGQRWMRFKNCWLAGWGTAQDTLGEATNSLIQAP